MSLTTDIDSDAILVQGIFILRFFMWPEIKLKGTFCSSSSNASSLSSKF